MDTDEVKRQKYLETSVLTATKEELILKIFDYLIMSATQACKRFYEAGHDIEGIHKYLLRSQRALTLLMGSLNFEVGGELATNLFNVYEWWHHELVMANMQRDVERVERLLPYFKDYRQSWAQAISEYRALQRTESSGVTGQGFVAVG